MKALCNKIRAVLFVAIALCATAVPVRAGDCSAAAASASGYSTIFNALGICDGSLHTGAFVSGTGINYVGCADINIDYVEKYYSEFGYGSAAEFTAALLSDECLQQKLAARILKDVCGTGATSAQKICGYYTGTCTSTCDQVSVVIAKLTNAQSSGVLVPQGNTLLSSLVGSTKASSTSASAANGTSEYDSSNIPQDTCTSVFGNSAYFIDGFKASMVYGAKNHYAVTHKEIDKVLTDSSSGDLLPTIETKYCLAQIKASYLNDIVGEDPSDEDFAKDQWKDIWGDGISITNSCSDTNSLLCISIDDMMGNIASDSVVEKSCNGTKFDGTAISPAQVLVMPEKASGASSSSSSDSLVVKWFTILKSAVSSAITSIVNSITGDGSILAYFNYMQNKGEDYNANPDYSFPYKK